MNLTHSSAAPEEKSPASVVAQVFGEYLPTSQLRAYTGRSAHCWKMDRMRGEGPPYISMGGRVYYRKVDLDAYMARHLVHPKHTA